MSGILGIAVSGLNAAASRVSNATNNIVNASSTNFKPQDVVSISNASGGVSTQTQPRTPATDSTGAPNVDIASELVTTKSAQATYSANAAVVKVAKKLDDALLDITT